VFWLWLQGVVMEKNAQLEGSYKALLDYLQETQEKYQGTLEIFMLKITGMELWHWVLQNHTYFCYFFFSLFQGEEPSARGVCSPLIIMILTTTTTTTVYFINA
jgi:hypothetical protein